MQCRNLEAGCYHDGAAHAGGAAGRCLVRGCGCAGFAGRGGDAAGPAPRKA